MKRSVQSDEELELETLMCCSDCMGPESKDDKTNKIDSLLPHIVQESMAAHMVPTKGPDACAIKMFNGEIRLSGCSKMFVKSDWEPAILGLLGAVKRERERERNR